MAQWWPKILILGLAACAALSCASASKNPELRAALRRCRGEAMDWCGGSPGDRFSCELALTRQCMGKLGWSKIRGIGWVRVQTDRDRTREVDQAVEAELL